MLSCLLLVSQLAVAGTPWYALPVVIDPQPVHYSYWSSYQQHWVEGTTGPRSSALFREPMSAASVYYALWDATGEQPWVETGTQERWRDSAISGASIAAEAMLWETVGRSPELSGAARFMRTFVSPNLELQRQDGRWRARANEPDIRMRPRMERRELQEGMVPGDDPPVPTVTVGSGLDVEELDALTDREHTVDASVWLRASQLGLDQLTLRGLVRSQTWELSGRQRVLRGLSAAAATSSRPASALPEDWGAGLSWTLPHRRWWSVMLRYRRDIVLLPVDELEWNLRLSVRWLPPARGPAQPGAWPLGQRVAAPGPVRPTPPPGQAVQAQGALPIAPGVAPEPVPQRTPGHELPPGQAQHQVSESSAARR